MHALFVVVYYALDMYKWVIIIAAISSWFVAFNVVNMRNRFVSVIIDTLNRLTEPALRPLRRVIPPLGGIDITPIILLLIIIFLQTLIVDNFLTRPLI